MARNAAHIDYRQDYYKGFAKIYFNRILETIIKLGDLRKEAGLILDYGCGKGHLKRKLGDKVIGYDIVPELTETSDYRNLKPAQIVLNNVLEHLYPEEIKNLLIDFERMNQRAILLICLPTENRVSKIMMRMAGYKSAHDDHVAGYREINKIIEEKYSPVKRRYLFLKMAQVTKYVKKS